jgi:predicted AAA+ superfamily ATPase
MNILLEQSDRLIGHTSLQFKRFLYQKINWQSRLIGIKGARGTGKTTMLLQWLKEINLPSSKAAYFSLDDLYFSQYSLKETVDTFYKAGGLILVLDEVHKYRNWAIEIKNCYDFYPELKIVFTGSSIIDLSKQQGDLSRRAIMYELPGLSFREFLWIRKVIEIEAIGLEEVLDSNSNWSRMLPSGFRPLEYFNDYLTFGYYPFILEDTAAVHQRINQLIRTIVEVDMAELKDFDVRNARKVLQLIYILALQVPFKPNITALATKTGIHRNSLNNYLYYLEQARIISLLYPAGNSVASLQKPEKIFLNNTNLAYALAEGQVETGAIRETFFYSQLSNLYSVEMPKQGDFLINHKWTFEIGGKRKSREQIVKVDNAWIVKDEIETASTGVIPLWMFGLLY